MKRSSKFLFFGFGLALGLQARELWKRSDDVKEQFGPVVMGWMAKGASLEDVSAELEASGKRITQQLIERLPSEKNYKILAHVIGIERWGQSRLQVALGQPLVLDEYDGYRPAMGQSWNELQDAFSTTREQTILLTEQLASAELGDVTVRHNEFGELSILQWLVYLRTHANSEIQWKMN